jgi:hypothetical protein
MLASNPGVSAPISLTNIQFREPRLCGADKPPKHVPAGLRVTPLVFGRPSGGPKFNSTGPSAVERSFETSAARQYQISASTTSQNKQSGCLVGSRRAWPFPPIRLLSLARSPHGAAMRISGRFSARRRRWASRRGRPSADGYTWRHLAGGCRSGRAASSDRSVP